MSKVLNIKDIEKLAAPEVEIPGFDNDSTIFVKMKKPSLMTLIAEGKVPNHLLGVATRMIGGNGSKPKGKEETSEEKTKNIVNMLELYCEICLVEPTYAELKAYLTDEQKEFIFDWGMGNVNKLSTFRNKPKV